MSDDVFAEGGPLEAAWFAVRELGVAMPPLPAALVGRLVQVDDAVFSSRASVDTLLDLDRLVAEAAADDAPPYVAFSHEGYGTANWRFRYAVVTPEVAAFVELPYGNAYDDVEACRGSLARAFAEIGALLASGADTGRVDVWRVDGHASRLRGRR